MNKEEFIGKLQMVYVGDKNASAEIISEYDRLKDIINQKESMYDNLAVDYRLEQEKTDRLNNLNKQLVEECQKLNGEQTRMNNIIDELEKWLKKEHENGYEVYYLMAIQDILDKLKSLKEK